MRRVSQQFILLSALLCLTGVLSGQTLTSPEKVRVGQPIPFKVEGAQNGDIITWQIFTPRIDGVIGLETEFKTEYFVDTGCSYVGPVEVLCTVVNFSAQKFDQRLLHTEVVKNPNPPPDPDPDPDPDPEPEPDPDWVSKVPDDKFDNLGKRVDTKAHELNLTRRDTLSAHFLQLSADMFSLKVRSTADATARINTFGPQYLPEWKPIFDLMRTDAAGRQFSFDEMAHYYNAIGVGIRGGG